MNLLIYALVFILLLFKLIKHRRFLYIVLVTLPRDIRAIGILVRLNIFLKYSKRTNKTVAAYFDSQVRKGRKQPCFYFEDEVWTYEMVQQQSYKIANYFQAMGYKKGDVVALLEQSCPMYVCIWLGLSRIGVITSCINYNLRLMGLEHCVNIVNCKTLMFGINFTHAIQEVIDAGGFRDLKFFSLNSEEEHVTIKLTVRHVDLIEELKSVDTKPTIVEETINTNDIVLYSYTSGSTGYPKACIMKHIIIIKFSVVWLTTRLKPGKDVVISPAPLYHGNAGIVGVTAPLFHGIPQVIVQKFSASKYWEWCIKYNVTVSQYIGEIIRYLYNQPEKSEDKLHNVRIFVGNGVGVNPVLWEKFEQRFKNVKIKEMYSSTEGNMGFMNFVGHIGACGAFPVWAYPFLPYFLAKVDDMGDIIRDKRTGLAVHVKTGEPGEILARISETDPMNQFDGYTDREATEKKIVYDIKKKGDRWFRSGDLLVLDEYGYLYFKDRCGDTFRWKSENVSTTEVEEVVTRGAGMKGSVVYGVPIPGHEGKCGMACIGDPQRNLNLKQLASEIMRSLPFYARPLFIRMTNQQLNTTGTFKLTKVELQKEAFDITKIKDTIYFFTEGSYVLLDKSLYQNVISGNIKF